MKQNIKICVPFYKICYSLCFLVILSLIRGVTYLEEIGPAMDANIALLAMVFCADTYVMEWNEKRWELFSLYSVKKKTWVIIQRLMAQIIYLNIISGIGYFFFFWQKPFSLKGDSEVFLYLMYFIAVTATILFWGTLSMTISNILHNQWGGIGVCMILWLVTNSSTGEKLLGDFNIFSYALRDINYVVTDYGWLAGKGIGFLGALIMIGSIPYILTTSNKFPVSNV